jgi:hypothetical protein
MHNIQAANMTDLAHKVMDYHLNNPAPDACLNIETHLFNVTLSCDDAEDFDLDVGKHLWLNRSRWSRLMKEYVPREGLDRFIRQCVEILRGEARHGATANMLFRDPDRYAKKHRWGGCLMGLTFRAGPKGFPPVLTMYSRTTYIGYMGFLDMAIATRIVKEIKDVYQNSFITGDEDDETAGDPPWLPIQFRWHLSSMQLHAFKSLPYIFSQQDLLVRLKHNAQRVKRGDTRMPPSWLYLSKWYNKILEHYKLFGVKMLEHEKYGPFKRIKRRWLEHNRYLTKHIPPTLLVADLGFTKCV